MNADDWINRWKHAARSEVPEPSSDFSNLVLERLDPDRPIPPLLWFCRIALVVLAAVVMVGRLVAIAAVFLTSTPLQ